MPTQLENLISEWLSKRSLYQRTRDPIITPPGIPNSPWTPPAQIVNPAGPPGIPTPLAEGTGTGGEAGRGSESGGSQPQGYGKMDPTMEAAFSGLPGVIGGAVLSGSKPSTSELAAGLLGTLASSMLGQTTTAPLGVLAAVSRYMASPYESNPFYGAPTPQDVQNAYDYGGVIAGQQKEAEMNAALTGYNAQVAADESGYASAARSTSATPGGFIGGVAPSPSVGNPDSPFGGDPNQRGSEFGTNMGNIGAAEAAQGMLGGFNDPGDRGGGQGGGDSDGDGGGGGGCFVRGTPITMEDGSTKPIEEIAVGDRVKSFDESRKEFVGGEVTELFPGKSSLFVSIIFPSGHEIICTPTHRFLTARGEWVEAQNIKPDTLLFSGDKIYPVISISLEEEVSVWNFRVEPLHTYVAGGQVVHNVKRKGGVRTVKRTTTETFGEPGTGGETGIFIPEYMKRPGLQGRERSVRRALEQYGRELGTSKKKQPAKGGK